LGLPYPGGPRLDDLASRGRDDVHAFPISRLGKDSLDFSFSGLKTAMLYAVQGVPGRDEPRTVADLTEDRRADLAAGFQRAAVEALMLKVKRAFDRHPCSTLIVGGGVSANSRLRDALASFASAKGVDLYLPPMTYCVDNAAMIAGLGHALLDAGRVADLTLTPVPTTGC
ncbi:MAG: hypothetical protein KDA28_10485, partial [Phycisphaerales bacterium]|nr:hypothetical protein [Phycisphaerales bacterium]